MPSVRIAAVADVRKDAADRLADTFDVPSYSQAADLIADENVHLVHIATPPSSHTALVLQAAQAGKHCLCEKPLAMNTAQADEMLAAARAKQIIMPVNFVLRYNAVTEAAKALIDDGVLGEVLSARLTNCASDATLSRQHWFWDKNQSGGIFIEHGVHFFDLYRYWLGPGNVLSAHAEMRPGNGQEDRVTCLVRHESGALVSHYHGFDQAGAMDRTDHRLVCEMGDLRIDGWIPLRLCVDAVVDEPSTDRLKACCPNAKVTAMKELPADQQTTQSRGRSRHVTKRIVLEYTPSQDKSAVYAESLRQLLSDQISFLHNRQHSRRITEENGRASLAMAQHAAELSAL